MTDLERKIVDAAKAIKQAGESSWQVWGDYARMLGTEDALDILQPILDEIEQRQEEEADD